VSDVHDLPNNFRENPWDLSSNYLGGAQSSYLGRPQNDHRCHQEAHHQLCNQDFNQGDKYKYKKGNQKI